VYALNNYILDLFNDNKIVAKIQRRLPYLYHLAELDSSRAGKIGMEVGSVREKIIVSLLLYKYGEENVETDIPITEPEVDVKLFGKPISIKTITGATLSGVKLIWTVDAQKAQEFLKNYYPCCDILLVQIVWNKSGGFYYMPLEAQKRVFKELGREKYIKLPKAGTNPRGAEFTKDALNKLSEDKETRVIKIDWTKQEIDYSPYKRWIDYWSAE
jgi:hypothetical protein